MAKTKAGGKNAAVTIPEGMQLVQGDFLEQINSTINQFKDTADNLIGTNNTLRSLVRDSTENEGFLTQRIQTLDRQRTTLVDSMVQEYLDLKSRILRVEQRMEAAGWTSRLTLEPAAAPPPPVPLNLDGTRR